MESTLAEAPRNVVERATDMTIALERASGGMMVLESEHPELKKLQLGELFGLTAKIVRELLAIRHRCDGNHAGQRCVDPECWHQ